MLEVDSEFQGLIERHEMGFAYKRITEQLGPSPQLLAFLNYDNVTSESLGLESLNIIDQHEVALTQIGESEASFHIATEGFFSGLKSMLSGIHNRLFGKKAPPPPPINLSDLMTGKLVLKEHNAPVVSYADFQKLIAIASNVHKDVDKLISFVPASHDMDTWQAFYDKHIKNRQTSQLDKVVFNIKLNRTAYNKIEGNKVPFARSGWTTTTFRAALVALAKNVHDYDQMREKIEHVCSDIYDTVNEISASHQQQEEDRVGRKNDIHGSLNNLHAHITNNPFKYNLIGDVVNRVANEARRQRNKEAHEELMKAVPAKCAAAMSLLTNAIDRATSLSRHCRNSATQVLVTTANHFELASKKKVESTPDV